MFGLYALTGSSIHVGAPDADELQICAPIGPILSRSRSAVSTSSRWAPMLRDGFVLAGGVAEEVAENSWNRGISSLEFRGLRSHAENGAEKIRWRQRGAGCSSFQRYALRPGDGG